MRHLFAVMASVFLVHFTSLGLAQALDPNEKRIDDLISQMTLVEKVDMLSGINEFDTKPLPRLGIPAIKMTDGPLGVRNGPHTAFPAGIAMAASFDPQLVGQVSSAIADEARAMGRNMLLGPCVNISRQPFGGRNFESFGEDPFLTSQLAVSYIHGVQNQHVLASVKHFALNDQEQDRMTIDVKADLRTMFEIHFPAFKAAVDAGSWTVMASYNKLNGHWASENDFLLNTVLKGLWNFQGFVVSDWGATHSTVLAANSGLDLEMPSGDFFNAELVKAVQDGLVSENLINDKVRRLLRAMFAIGIMDPTQVNPLPAALGPDSREHRDLALKAAQESLVLLKNNDSLLPLRNLKTVAVIGPNAAIARTGGGGSSQVDPLYSVTPLQGLRDRLGRDVRVLYAMGAPLPDEVPTIPSMNLRPQIHSKVNGLKAEYYAGTDLTGKPLFSRVDQTVDFKFNDVNDPRLQNNFSVRWTGFLIPDQSGVYKISTVSDDGVRLYLNGRQMINNWTDHGETVDSFEVTLTAGKTYALRLEYYQAGGDSHITLGWETSAQNILAQAVLAAKQADVAVLFMGLSRNLESEAVDRTSFDLPVGQVELINAVAKANPRTVVVMNSGNPVPMSGWINQVKSVLQVWYTGQETGHAIADVLVGNINPSGKLPVTFLKRWEDSPAYGNYPGQNGEVHYSEGIFVGYRHFDAKNILPEFPFGYGLSYTNFSFHDLNIQNLNTKMAKADLSFQVTNTGSVAGAEVAQLYVGEHSPLVPRPVRELKAFQKVWLAPGETKTVVLHLDQTSFAYFDANDMRWKINPGLFRLEIGSSSRDLFLEKDIELNSPLVF